jgi:hypothetical protein
MDALACNGMRARLNLRRRFWRWVLGFEEPLYTRATVEYNAKLAIEQAMSKDVGAINGQRRFQIIDAMNGKIIRFTGPLGMEDDALMGGQSSMLRKETIRQGEQYFVVPNGEDLLGAIARVLTIDRVSK